MGVVKEVKHMTKSELENVIHSCLAKWNARHDSRNDLDDKRYRQARERLNDEFGEEWTIHLTEDSQLLYELRIRHPVTRLGPPPPPQGRGRCHRDMKVGMMACIRRYFCGSAG